ncbi:MAG: transposase [Myxococcota bacterium]
MCLALDVSSLERQYSSLGRRAVHPRRKLAVLVYASLTGLHEASRIERAAKTDAAFQFLSGGHNVSATMLRTFQRENVEFFQNALEQTVQIAAELELLDGRELALDSVRVRADASSKSIRTLNRSRERLEELGRIDRDGLDEAAKVIHDAKVKKHTEAVRRCEDEGRTSLSVTTPSAALLKFPSGAALPGHRVTVAAAGVKLRFVVAVVLGSAATDHGLLRPATLETQRILQKSGITGQLQMAADAGFRSHDDLQFAIDHRSEVDILVNDPPEPRRQKSKKKGGIFSKAEFDFREDGTVHCPAGRQMEGPVKAGKGKIRWRGVGCEGCALRQNCTTVGTRQVIVDEERERLHRATRDRMAEDGAAERYRRRIATVEPVFAYIEDAMGFTRASTRHTQAVHAQILLKILAYNLGRLFFCPSDQLAWVEGVFDGQNIKTTAVNVVSARSSSRLGANPISADPVNAER